VPSSRLFPAAAWLAVSSACSAQTSYRLADLGALRQDGESWAFGVNEAGQVAGLSLFDVPDRQMTGVRMSAGQITDLGRLEGGLYAWAWAINDAGHVAGTSNRVIVFNDQTFAYRYDGTELILLDQLSTNVGTEAFDINSAGVVVGSASPGPPLINTQVPVRWDGTQVTRLDDLGGFNGYARAINDHEDIVGAAELPSGPMRACLWRDGAASDLGTLGGRGSDAFDVNDAGQIVGWAHDAAGVERACLWEDGAAADLGTLGTSSRALAINESGWIVGTSWVIGEGQRAFVRTEAGEVLNLNERVRQAPGWILQHANDINESGVIVGYGRANGRTRAFLLTPICDGDFNADGELDLFDFLAFQSAFGNDDPSADLNSDGILNLFDFLSFVNVFNVGC
jgi:probable HAF family extracellular repeat protein